ncbi:GNAT family N-acetyltransferase [Hyalangium gracile]|uniref:GNAT family N-acetyltransferase n=1 Tax=Hyalangium gracile TaxID=394092 RepID=UPI001CC8F548|nr:GNAT family N-acetyltransferase [Hyalangium gracile]
MVETPEVYIASANVPWGIMNAAFLPNPVETEVALERSAAAAIRYFAPRKNGWMYVVCEDWLSPGLRPKAAALLEAQGLKQLMSTTGMVAEHLKTPTRELPSIEVRHATDTEALGHIADINAVAYASPLEVARQSVVVPALFQGNSRGYVGYVDGKAVSVAAVVRVQDVAYVGYVATLADQRRRGYAEAVMRQGLADARRVWGLERTVLHATEAGHPVYLRMGYRDVTRFAFYMPVGPGH